MRALTYLSLITILTCLSAPAQISKKTWAQALSTRLGIYGSAHQAHLTAAQSASLTHFIQSQYRRHADFYHATPISDTCGAVADCLDIQPLGSSFPGIFVVSPTPHQKNPAFWLIRFDDSHVSNLTPIIKDPHYGAVDIAFGYLSVLKPVHNGLHDLAIVHTLGANEEDLTYLQFTGTRYRAIASHHFKGCSETPGHANTDEDHWCTSNGTIIANRQ